MEGWKDPVMMGLNFEFGYKFIKNTIKWVIFMLKSF